MIGVLALGLATSAIVMTVTALVSRRVGKVAVVDVAWGLVFVAIAWVMVAVSPDAHSLLLRHAGRDGQEGPPTRRAFSALLRIDNTAIPAAIVFMPQGMSSGGRLTVETPGPRRYVVSVDPLTGRVTTQRGPQ